MNLAQAVLTALLSGIFSGAVLFGLGERRERRAFILGKAEEATAAFVEWHEAMSSWPGAHYLLFTGMGHEAGKKEIDSIFKQASVAGAKAQMLIQIYLPRDAGVISDLVKSYRPMFDLSVELYNAALLSKPLPSDAGEKIGAIQKVIVDAGASGVSRLYQSTRQLAHAPFLVGIPFHRAFRKLRARLTRRRK